MTSVGSSKDSPICGTGVPQDSTGNVICMNDLENGVFSAMSCHKLAHMGKEPLALPRNASHGISDAHYSVVCCVSVFAWDS